MSRVKPWSEHWNPAEEGAVRRLADTSEGVPWEAWIQWHDSGWTRTVALQIGHPADPTTLTPDPDFSAGDLSAPRPPMAAIPVDAPARIAALVEHRRADIEVTQKAAMVFRAVDEGALAPGAAPKLLAALPFLRRPGADPHDEVAIVAGLYELFAELGRRSPAEDAADALSLGRATVGRRLTQARKRGLLPPARQGTTGIRRRP